MWGNFSSTHISHFLWRSTRLAILVLPGGVVASPFLTILMAGGCLPVKLDLRGDTAGVAAVFVTAIVALTDVKSPLAACAFQL